MEFIQILLLNYIRYLLYNIYKYYNIYIMFRLSRILLNEHKKYLMNVLEYQLIGINLDIYNTKDEIDIFLLKLEIEKIEDIKRKIRLDQYNNDELNDILKTYKKN